MIDAVVFDVGETLLDETRQHGAWAAWLGVPRHTFSALFGAMVATGREFRDVFPHFKPDFDLAAERQRRAENGDLDTFTEADLYPDALVVQGVWVGIAGKQSSSVCAWLRDMD